MREPHKTLAAWLLGGLLSFAGCASAQEASPSTDAPADPPAEQPQPRPEQRTDPAVVDLLQRIEEASAEIDTLRCRVRYTRTQTLLGDQQVRYGDFYYAARTDDSPNRFAILFDRMVVDGRARPMQTWFIFDGNWLLERDHEDKTAVRRELVAEGTERGDVLDLGDGQMPIPLRLKADEVLDRYTVAQLPDEPFGERTLHHLRLTPRRGGADAEPLHLWFDTETLELYKVVTLEGDDEVELVFSLIKPNAEIETGTFDTALPDPADGWQVQESPLSR